MYYKESIMKQLINIILVLAMFLVLGGCSKDDSTIPNTGEIEHIKILSIYEDESLYSVSETCELDNNKLIYVVANIDSNKSEIFIRDKVSNSQTEQVLSTNLWKVRSLVCSPSGDSFAVAVGDEVRLYRQGTNTSYMSDTIIGVDHLIYTHDGEKLIAVSSDHTAYIYNTLSLLLLKSFDTAIGYTSKRNVLGVSDDDATMVLLGGYENEKLVVIDLNSTLAREVTTPALSGTFSQAFYENNSKLVVGSGHGDGHIYIVDLNNVTEIERYDIGLENYIYDMKIINQHYLLAGGYDHDFVLYDLATHSVIAHEPLAIINNIEVLLNGDVVVSTGAGRGGSIFTLKVTP